MSDIVERLRAEAKWANPRGCDHRDIMLEAASEIEHFRLVYGHITPDQADKIKTFQASMREFQKQFPDKPLPPPIQRAELLRQNEG